MNDMGQELLRRHNNTVLALPCCVKNSYKRLKDPLKGANGRTILYREIAEPCPCPYCCAMAMRFDEDGSRYPPLKGKGTVFFIDPRLCG